MSAALPPWRRAFLALGMGMVLAFGTAAPHAPTAEHTDSPTGVEIDRSARHPGEPVHLESAEPEFHPGCAVCLLQLQSGSSLPVPAALPTPAPVGEIPAAGNAVAAHLTTESGPARAPPALSTSL